MRRCHKCGADKLLTDFKPCNGGKNRRRVCKKCNQDRTNELARTPEGKKKSALYYATFKKKHPGNSCILGRYGVTQEVYAKLFELQGGVCALCKKRPLRRKLAVDHCHKTWIIRGLLCHFCNMMLGRFDDNPAGFFRVILYLLEDGFANLRIYVP